MNPKVSDWKDVANHYYEKAVTLALLILLFTFLAFPKFEVKPYEIITEEIIGIELTPDIKDPVPPPNTLIKPDITLVYEEDFNEEDPDVIILPTLEPTILDPYNTNPGNFLGNTEKFVYFEDPPVPIKQISPVYSSMARNVGLEGIVGLEVEVFADGSVGAVEVLRSLQSGPGGLDNEAINAVKQWEFQPAKSNGHPIAVWTYLEIEFRLD